jgi:hypothetical protein
VALLSHQQTENACQMSTEVWDSSDSATCQRRDKRPAGDDVPKLDPRTVLWPPLHSSVYMIDRFCERGYRLLPGIFDAARNLF